MRISLLCAPLLLLLAVPTWAEDEKTAKIDSPKIDGTYTITSGEHCGKLVPPERLRGSIIMIKGNTITGTDKDEKEFFACTFKVTALKDSMYSITMTSISPEKGTIAQGILRLESGFVKLAYALPDGETPSSFAATKDKQLSFVLRPNDVKR